MPRPAERREYFYRVDLRGRLWHADTELTDPKFLDFFFRRLRPNATGRHADHPFVSPCAGERNYLRCEDRPIVFHGLTTDGRLTYAASLGISFDPGALRHSSTGRLYHPAPVGEFGLLRSDLALSLMAALDREGEDFVLRWQGKRHVIPPL